MRLVYEFDMETPGDLLGEVARKLRQRRLEKGWSREMLAEASGVPAPTIAKFERQHTISLASFVALAKALGHARDVKNLLAEPLYSTMEELETINRNKHRKRGRHERS